jgi:DNA-binding NtrC family response regulator
MDKKIFIVDDDPFHLMLVQQVLINNGFEDVFLFESGTACLENLEKNPDIIILDHNMDTLTGYEVLRKIKRHNPDIFVIMVSAQEEISTAVNSLKHGAFDYLQKGADIEPKLLEVLNRIDLVKEKLLLKKNTFLKSLFGNSMQ